MHVRVSRLVPALALSALAACSSDDNGPTFYQTPLPATLLVGDLVRVNVNGEDALTIPPTTWRASRPSATRR